MKQLSTEVINNAISYAEYRHLIDTLLEDNKVTGTVQGEDMVAYTQLNVSRMNRIDRKDRTSSSLIDRIKEINVPLLWVTITEGWCGDAAQIIPLIEHLASHNPHITTRYILRHQHPEVMNAFLTDGAQAIPMTLFVAPDTGSILGAWGPRPAAAQKIIIDSKKAKARAATEAEKASIGKESSTHLHQWYARDRGATTQAEFTDALFQTVNKLALAE